MLIALPTRATVRVAFPWLILGLSLMVLAFSLAFHETLFHGRLLYAGVAKKAEPKPAPSKTEVTLPDGKFKVAGIATASVEFESLVSEVGVSGRIEANQNRQVQIRPRASGVVREVRVVLGAVVKKGQTLAVLDSADVGTARLHLRAKQRELATVRTEADWKKQASANVAALVVELKKGTEAEIIDKQFANRPLGTFRSQLLQAYADYDIAVHEEEKTSELRKKMIIGEHPVFVAKHTREAAQAKYEGSIEQTRFDANQQALVANQEVRLAEAGVIDAAQRLRILGVTEDIDTLLAKAADASVAKLADEDVVAYPIFAPFDGTVIARTVVPSQKAEVTDILFTLADLGTVWVSADIPESDFGLIPKLQTGTIRMTAGAYPDRNFAAKLLSVGATVDPSTRTVPILAETPNPDGALKLGMFARITLDGNTQEQALTVPTSAVVEIEGKSGVFIPGKDEHQYVFRPVILGREAGGRRVVASGLAKGDTVVSKGAFLLKSELILQNETDEE